MKHRRVLTALGAVLALGLGLTLAVEAEVAKPASCLDKNACAEKIRFGRESFDRARYQEAKDYFRQAVQADPSSVRAWSFYDLSVMYAVAEQVKTTGSVKSSPAPTPDSLASPEAPAKPAAPAPPAAESPGPAPSSAPPAIPNIKPDEGC